MAFSWLLIPVAFSQPAPTRLTTVLGPALGQPDGPDPAALGSSQTAM
jgi:hypothetical protein